MTADRRLRIGGWAALLAAILTPLALALLFLVPAGADLATSRPFVLTETARMGALLVAVAGLHGLFSRHDPDLADRIRLLGLVGTGVSFVLDMTVLVGLGPTPLDLFTLPAWMLVGVWFLGAGRILLSDGRSSAWIGWTALAGGASAILVAIGVVVSFGGDFGGTGHAIRNSFALLGLLAVVFLVWMWREAVGGRLPGPGNR